MRPRKSWGQHFLVDYNIQRKILDLARIQPKDRVVEIGTGYGILTKGLLERGADVIGIELDRHLVQLLREEIPAASLLHLIEGDALRFPYQEVQGPYKVVANLPYYIATPLLFRLLDARQHILLMVLMLQKEVADRMVASVGDKSYGALSVIVQFYADVQVAFPVLRSCFRPRPGIDSCVVTVTPSPAPKASVLNEPYFLKVVKGAFAYRRKRLANALFHAGFPMLAIEAAIREVGLIPMRRGETLSLGEFASLANALFLQGAEKD